MKVKICFLLLPLTGILVNCNNDQKYDYSDFGEEVFRSLLNKDTVKLNKFFYDEIDSNSVIKSYSQINNERLTTPSFTTEELQMLAGEKEPIINTIYTQSSINEWFSKAKKDGFFSDTSLSFKKVVIDSSRSSEYKNKIIDLKVFFELKDTTNFFKLNGLMKLNSGFKFSDMTEPNSKWDILKQKRKRWKEKNLNRKIIIKSANWRYRYSTPEKFENFYLTISNRTKNDFNYIKINVSIYSDGSRFSRNEVFNRTYERRVDMYKGNVIRLEIKDLSDFYLGRKIKDQTEWDWDARIEDIKPVPVNFSF